METKPAASSTCYQQEQPALGQDHGHEHGHDHAHDHGHAHGHAHAHKPVSGETIDRSFIFALLITGGFAFVEAAGGWYAHSLALISDAGHMATDAAALLIALMAARLARRPASASKSYGYGRAEVIGAFVNGLVMLAVVVWIMVEAVARILEPQPVAGPWVIGIAAVGLAVNLLVLGVLSHGHHSLNSRAAVLHVLGDLLGSVAAIVAGAVVTFTSWTLIDPLLSMAVSLLILRSTWRLLVESVNVLMEAVPEDLDYHVVERRLAEIGGVAAVHDLHVWQMSSEGRALSAHILIDSHERWPRVLEEAREVLRREFGVGHVTLQPVWPRLARSEGADHRHEHHEHHGHDHAREDGHGQRDEHRHEHINTQETGTHGKGKSA